MKTLRSTVLGATTGFMLLGSVATLQSAMAASTGTGATTPSASHATPPSGPGAATPSTAIPTPRSSGAPRSPSTLTPPPGGSSTLPNSTFGNENNSGMQPAPGTHTDDSNGIGSVNGATDPMGTGTAPAMNAPIDPSGTGATGTKSSGRSGAAAGRAQGSTQRRGASPNPNAPSVRPVVPSDPGAPVQSVH
jgi:hypothetical protein